MGEPNYSPEVIHTAFMLWWETCNRDPAKVASELRMDEWAREVAGLKDGERSPDARTIKRWAREKFWDLTAADKMREAAPSRMRAAAARIVYAQADAAEYLADSVTTERKLDTSDRIKSENAKSILAMGMGSALADRLKPVISDALELDNLESIDDVHEALRRLRAQAE